MKRGLVWLSAFVFVLASCNSGCIYTDYVDFSGECWNNDDTVTLHIPKDFIKKGRTPKLAVRTSEKYKYETLNVLVEQMGGKSVLRDTLSIELFDENGRSTGKGLVHQETTIALQTIEFDTVDYCCRIYSLMHSTPVEGISSLGLLLSESVEENIGEDYCSEDAE